MRIGERHRYAVSVGAFRIGTFLACAFLFVHVMVEPRRAPFFHPLVDALLVLAACAALGYLVGFAVWRARARRDGG